MPIAPIHLSTLVDSLVLAGRLGPDGRITVTERIEVGETVSKLSLSIEGLSQAAKLAHQLVFGLNVMALLEGLALGAAGGVAPDAMKAVLKQGLAKFHRLRQCSTWNICW